MSTEIRPIVPEEFDAYVAADAAGFAWEPDPEQMEHTRAVLELDRTLASFEDGEIVGTAAIFSFQMTVPGGSLPTAGVTWVSVKPTHRRGGVLTGMMRKQLNDVRERGEPFAALWASESIIYGRFGYGQAAEATELTIDRTRTEFAHEPPNCGRVRLLSRTDALDGWPALYDRVLTTQPGAYSRTSAWWEAPHPPAERTQLARRRQVLRPVRGGRRASGIRSLSGKEQL